MMGEKKSDKILKEFLSQFIETLLDAAAIKFMKFYEICDLENSKNSQSRQKLFYALKNIFRCSGEKFLIQF